MTMQNPLALLNSFTPSVQDLMNARLTGQQTQSNQLGLDQQRILNPLAIEQQQLTNQGLQQQVKQQEINTRGLESAENISNTVNRLQEVERLIGGGATSQQLEQTLTGFIADSQARGGNPADSVQALQALQQGGVKGLQGLLGQARDVFIKQGFLKAPAAKSIDFAKIDPAKFTQESVAKAEQSGRYSDLMPIGDPANEPVYIGELRKELRTDVGKLETEAKSLTTNFNKLSNLAAEMRTGKNRSAVAQGLVALVKLGDPGSVVKEEELKQALGAQSPTAAVADLLRDKGTSKGVIDAITQSIDPLNPASVNVDSILATAEAMLRPNADAIASSYEAAKNRSGQLSEGGRMSIFNDSRDKTFGGVSGLTFGVTGISAAEPVTQTFYDANDNPQQFKLSADGSQWEPM